MTDAQNATTDEAQPSSTLQSSPKSFADFGVRQDISDALAAVGIVSPFPIQEMTLPVALAGHDIIGQAKTGTGKTLGFGLPTIQRVVGRDDDQWGSLQKPGAPQALILVPTRELAIQVGNDLAVASKLRNARVATLYGGVPYEPQVEQLTKGLEVVVGTPGRLIDLYQHGALTLTQVKTVVLDEADEMLDLGFLPSVEKIMGYLPTDRQTMLFSATMPGPVITMARKYMTKPMHISAADPEDHAKTKASIRQVVYRVHHMDKDEMLGRILRAHGRGRTVIFTKTKRDAARVADELIARGFAAAPLHGDLNQGAREQALRAFRNGKVDILVATDVAARGIDVEDVTHVINHRVPEDEKTYLHRTGRTGRAGHEGTAVTFVDWEDIARWRLINDALDLGVSDPVETYSSSEHLFYDLDIPPGTKGRLPRSEQTLEGLDAEHLDDYGESRSSRGSSRSSRGSRSRGSKSRGSRGGSRKTKSEKRGEDSSSKDAAPKRERRPRRRTRRVEGETVETRAEKTAGKSAEKKSAKKSGSAKDSSVEKTDSQGLSRRRSRRRSGNKGKADSTAAKKAGRKKSDTALGEE
ncbi:DEAD/DEAH box helicase [Rothia dentocariosa]|uniref:DEAD/DEAH box helicase n=1 Tax=Rothia dentocariosa TaxID=2047 RepID=UPI000C79B262|nr:DEAD/DEAH box helicase [Rothia dentocariosa]PLA19901.1 DNA helicase [Rothia dentocariosa]